MPSSRAGLRVDEAELRLPRNARLREAIEQAEAKGRSRAAPREPAPKPRHGGRKADKAEMFLGYWKLDPATKELPEPVPEHRFARARRREFRFDWAWPELLLAVEVDGGRWAPGGGRHGSDEDRTKLNLAAAIGWRVFRVAPSQLKAEAPVFVTLVAETVRGALPATPE